MLGTNAPYTQCPPAVLPFAVDSPPPPPPSPFPSFSLLCPGCDRKADAVTSAAFTNELTATIHPRRSRSHDRINRSVESSRVTPHHPPLTTRPQHDWTSRSNNPPSPSSLPPLSLPHPSSLLSSRPHPACPLAHDNATTTHGRVARLNPGA
jgi:hypothetical protein